MTLDIRLPEELRSKAEARAAELGCGSVAAYVEALVRADVGEDFGALDHLAARNDAELEALLIRRLENTEPGLEATPKFWQKLSEKARRRRERGAGR